MLDVMTRLNVSWEELATVWPWSRVRRAHDAIATDRFLAAWPVARLTQFYHSANSQKGARALQLTDILPDPLLPPNLRREAIDAKNAIYEPEMVRAYELGRKLGFIGNAHLAAFGATELRASGWVAS